MNSEDSGITESSSSAAPEIHMEPNEVPSDTQMEELRWPASVDMVAGGRPQK